MRAEKHHPRALPFAQPLAVAVDVVVLTVAAGALKVLLTRRTREPFKGQWSLPGGFIGAEESADQAAARELTAKTSVSGVFLEQLYTFTAPRRDPRTRVISIAYYALIAQERLASAGGTRESRWLDVRAQVPELRLAFDHAEILRTALERIQGKLDYAPIGFQLLPDKFTLSDIQAVYEAILGRSVDKRNFRSKLLKSDLIRELEEQRTGAHRPARLYAFKDRTF